MSEWFGKDQYELLEKNTSPRIALRLYRVGVIALFFGALLVIGDFVFKLSDYVISPSVAFIAAFLTKHNPKLPVGLGNVFVSLALTVLLLIIAGYLARRWFKTWESRNDEILSEYLKRRYGGVEADVRHLKQNAADVKTTKKAIQDLMRRVSRLEPPKTVETPAGPVPLSLAALTRAALVGEEDGIKSVGDRPPIQATYRDTEAVEGGNEPRSK